MENFNELSMGKQCSIYDILRNLNKEEFLKIINDFLINHLTHVHSMVRIN